MKTIHKISLAILIVSTLFVGTANSEEPKSKPPVFVPYLPAKVKCVEAYASAGRFKLVSACTSEDCSLYFVDTCSGEILKEKNLAPWE